MNYRANIVRIKSVCNALGELAKDVVFVGGATVAFYADRPVTEVRPTDDVDILVELLNYRGYAEIENRLRERGFVNDVESGVICRYKIQGIIVDVMPTSSEILGFSNKWYPAGFTSSVQMKIDEQSTIRIFAPEYFLATKLEAYSDRGEGDGRFSTDFEDIVFLLNYRNGIWDELHRAATELKQYFLKKFAELLGEKFLYEWISSHLELSEQGRVSYILGGLQNFVDNESIRKSEER